MMESKPLPANEGARKACAGALLLSNAALR